MNKRIGAIDDDIVLIGGLAIGGILLVKYIGATFGTDPASKQKYDDQGNKTPDTNAFSPNFKPFIDNFNTYANGITVQDVMLSVQQQGDSGNLTPGTNSFQIYTWAKTLEDALSVWNWRVDTNAVLSVFSQMENQTQCASLAAYCNYVLNKDLLHWLHYGGSAIPFVPNGLSVDQIAIIIDEINNLPS